MRNDVAQDSSRPLGYERIRKEIVAYDEIARRRSEIDIEDLAREMVGAGLLARYREVGEVSDFPVPSSIWLDSVANPVSHRQAYEWIAPIRGRHFVQLGGSGSHAIKALLGGASQATLITPMEDEGSLAILVARYLGCDDRLNVVQGIGEKIPFGDSSLDVIFGGGTLHHIKLNQGFAEVLRVLKPGGRAAFVDPNLNLIYRFFEVTRLRNLVREPGAQCYPLRTKDVRASAIGFRVVRLELAGGPMRYAIVGATRLLKVAVPLSVSLKLQTIESQILSALPMRSALGGLAVLVEK